MRPVYQDGAWRLLGRIVDGIGRNAVVLAAIFGIGFLRSCLSWVLASSQLLRTSMQLATNPHLFSALGELVGFVIVVLIVLRGGALAWRGRLLLAGVLVLGAGVTLVTVASWPNVAAAALVIVGNLLTGIGYAQLLVFWLECCGLNSPRKAVFAVAASYCVSLLTWLTVEQAAASVALPLMIGFCALSALLLVYAYGKSDERDVASLGETSQVAFSPRLLVWVALLSMAYGFGDATTGMGFSTLASKLGMVLPAVVIGIGLVVRRARMDLTFIYWLTLPFMLVGLLASLASDSFLFAGQVLMSAALVNITTIACGIACMSAYLNHGSSALSCGVILSVNAVFCKAGNLLGGSAGEAGGILILCVMAVAVVFSMLMLSDKSFSALVVMTSDQTRDRRQRLERAADEHQLSPREKAVFLSLADGKNAAEISEDLYIASGTVRAHISRIYEKLGVHGRQEFDEWVGAMLDSDLAR